jgi:hypothetical protein
MTRTALIFVSAVAALGILIGLAVMLRGEAPSEAVARRSGPIPAAPTAALATVEAPDPDLLRRVDEVEGRLNQLLKRRDELAKSNESIRKEIKVAQVERGYKANAPDFVGMLVRKVGGATEAQQGALSDIWVRWHKEDELVDAWRTEDEAQLRRRVLEREAELRALLSPEQQAKMQSAAAAGIKTRWYQVALYIANDLGYPIAGVSREEMNRSVSKVQGMIGSAPDATSSTMMLTGAYGMDFMSLKRIAAERVRPQLPPEDSRRLQGLTPEEMRRAIAGSWAADWQ